MNLPLLPCSPRHLLTAALSVLAASTAPAALSPTAEVTEGPYHPFNSRNTLPEIAAANRDNDLTRLAGATRTAEGTPFLLSGVVRDLSGRPLAGLKVELWQTDDKGVYYHSGDSNVAKRDPHFQFYGECITGPDGAYSFRTIKPGEYTGRIRHFHYKVSRGGTTLLTSQFTFDDEREAFARDNVQRRLSGEELESTVIAPRRATDEEGATVLMATKDIVVGPNGKSGGGRAGSERSRARR